MSEDTSGRIDTAFVCLSVCLFVCLSVCLLVSPPIGPCAGWQLFVSAYCDLHRSVCVSLTPSQSPCVCVCLKGILVHHHRALTHHCPATACVEHVTSSHPLLCYVDLPAVYRGGRPGARTDGYQCSSVLAEQGAGQRQGQGRERQILHVRCC